MVVSITQPVYFSRRFTEAQDMSWFINGLQIKLTAGGITSCFNYCVTEMLSAGSLSSSWRRNGSINFLWLPTVLGTWGDSRAHHCKSILTELNHGIVSIRISNYRLLPTSRYIQCLSDLLSCGGLRRRSHQGRLHKLNSGKFSLTHTSAIRVASGK